MCATTSMSTFSGLRRRIAIFAAFLFAVLVFIVVLHYSETSSKFHEFNVKKLVFSAINDVLPSPHRKLLSRHRVDEPTRFWGDAKECAESDIQISQGPSSPLPSGIPTYTVEVTNACVSGCDIAQIHLRCGWFSSAQLIDPYIFRRVHFDDCVINAGRTLPHGQSITFQYANTHSYPLSVSSMSCY